MMPIRCSRAVSATPLLVDIEWGDGVDQLLALTATGAPYEGETDSARLAESLSGKQNRFRLKLRPIANNVAGKDGSASYLAESSNRSTAQGTGSDVASLLV